MIKGEREDKLEKLSKKDGNEMVTFYFRMLAFDDKSKGFLEFPFRKSPDKVIQNYKWYDGVKYTAPKSVVEYVSTRFVTAPANEADANDESTLKKVYRFELDIL